MTLEGYQVNGFMDLARSRCSTRAYKAGPGPEADIFTVLEAARLAPSASNKQPWHFIVVRDPERRAELTRIAGGQRFVGEAPVVIAAVALDPARVMTCGVPSYAVDLAIAVDHMTLAAEDLGLGTCWIGLFDQDEARQILEVPEDKTIVTLLPMGYPAAAPKPKSRKELGEIYSWETFPGEEAGGE